MEVLETLCHSGGIVGVSVNEAGLIDPETLTVKWYIRNLRYAHHARITGKYFICSSKGNSKDSIELREILTGKTVWKYSFVTGYTNLNITIIGKHFICNTKDGIEFREILTGKIVCKYNLDGWDVYSFK